MTGHKVTQREAVEALESAIEAIDSIVLLHEYVSVGMRDSQEMMTLALELTRRSWLEDEGQHGNDKSGERNDEGIDGEAVRFLGQINRISGSIRRLFGGLDLS